MGCDKGDNGQPAIPSTPSMRVWRLLKSTYRIFFKLLREINEKDSQYGPFEIYFELQLQNFIFPLNYFYL